MRLPKKGSLLREVPIIIVSALVVSVIIKTFFLHFFFIPSGSMENTLQVGDRIAVNKLANFVSDIRRGEVVVFRDPAQWLGQPAPDSGSTVVRALKAGLESVGILPDPAVCCDVKGHLTVNGVSVTEPYIFAGNAPSDSKFSVTVPKGFIWVMGDHRGASADSRFHTDDIHKGMVPLKDVVGRAEFVVWPFSHVKFLSVGHDLSKVAVKPAQH